MKIQAFGKEIEMEQKHISILSVVIIFVLIIGGAYPLILKKSFTLKAKTEEEKVELVNMNRSINLLDKEKAVFERVSKLHEDRKMYLKDLTQKFQNASLKDETDLKVAIQSMFDYLKLNMIQTGKSEIAEDKKSYSKKYIPYTIQGEFYKVARFFYYIENSKWLISFKGSDLIIKQIESQKGEPEKIQVQFKIGAYYIDKEGDFTLE